MSRMKMNCLPVQLLSDLKEPRYVRLNDDCVICINHKTSAEERVWEQDVEVRKEESGKELKEEDNKKWNRE